MRYFSMFSGIGGFELGIKQAYENKLVEVTTDTLSERDTPQSESGGWFGKYAPDCIGYSEIDKYAIQIYERHFNHKNYGDATTIIATELPNFDLLVGGFPCQAFSIAGKRGGLEDSRGTLFYDIARIAKEKRPQHLLLENVKGLLSHDNGRTFKLIISTFAELGYNLEWQVLNSKNFGVPQNRERVFIIGHLGACCGRQVFPIGDNDKEITKSNIKQIVSGSQGDRVCDSSGISVTLASQAGGLGAKTGLYSMPFVQNPKMQDYKKNYKNVGAITASSYKEPPVVNGIRRLTPTECERLQAYPDGWTEGVSDTQRYKTLGNGVTVNVVRELIKRLYH